MNLRIFQPLESLRTRFEIAESWARKWAARVPESLGLFYPESLTFVIVADIPLNRRREIIREAGEIFGRDMWTSEEAGGRVHWSKTVDGVTVRITGVEPPTAIAKANVPPLAFAA